MSSRTRKKRRKNILRGEKLINILDLALKKKQKGRSIFNKETDDKLIHHLYHRIMIMTNSKNYPKPNSRRGKKIIAKMKMLCQKAYYILESSFDKKFLRELERDVEKVYMSGEGGPSIEILRSQSGSKSKGLPKLFLNNFMGGGFFMKGGVLFETLAVYVAANAKVMVGSAILYTVSKIATKIWVQHEAAQTIARQAEDATNRALHSTEIELRNSGFDELEINEFRQDLQDVLNLDRARTAIACNNQGGKIVMRDFERSCICDPTRMNEPGSVCRNIIDKAKQMSISDAAPAAAAPAAAPATSQPLLDMPRAQNIVRSIDASARVLPRNSVVQYGHRFSMNDAAALNEVVVASSGRDLNIPDGMARRLEDDMMSSQVANWDDVYIEIELGNYGEDLSPAVVMQIMNNMEIVIRRISSAITEKGLMEIGKRSRKITEVATGGTTYGWLTPFSNSRAKKDAIIAELMRQKASITERILARKAAIKLIYNDLVRAIETALSTFQIASNQAERLTADAWWGITTAGAACISPEFIAAIVLNELNRNFNAPEIGRPGPMLELMDGPASFGGRRRRRRRKSKKRKSKKRKSKKRKSRKRRRKTKRR